MCSEWVCEVEIWLARPGCRLLFLASTLDIGHGMGRYGYRVGVLTVGARLCLDWYESLVRV